jgi:hypothetical protein
MLSCSALARLVQRQELARLQVPARLVRALLTLVRRQAPMPLRPVR